MRSLITLVTATLLIASISQAYDNLRPEPQSVRLPSNGTPRTADPRRTLDEVIYFEDWEGGSLNGWTPIDVNGGGNLWRVASDFSSPGGQHVLVCNEPPLDHYRRNMENIVRSPFIDLRGVTGYTTFDFMVTGSLPACTGFPDCDYWSVKVSIDSGLSWCYLSNPNCDPLGMNYVYVDAPTSWSSFVASYEGTGDLSLLQGHVILFELGLHTNSDANLDRGPSFDDFTLDHALGYPNDIACYTLQVRFPNVQGRPTRIKAYFSNPGQEPEFVVIAWYRIGSGSLGRFLPNLTLSPGQTDARQANIELVGAGPFTIRAFPSLLEDGNPTNDTSLVINVVNRPSAEDWEIGYDNREVTQSFQFQPGSGALIRATPVSDTVATSFNLNSILAQFDASQTEDATFRLHLYRGGSTAPGVEIYNEPVVVHPSETGPNVWKSIDVSATPATRLLNSDFWVWLEVLDSSSFRYPRMQGAPAEPWSDVHYYTWDGAGVPAASDHFYPVRARLAPVSPMIAWRPTTLSFGGVDTTGAQSRTLSAWITNSGTAPLLCSQFTITPATVRPAYLIGLAAPISIQAGDSIELRVTFGPSQVRSYNGTLTIANNSLNSPNATIALTASGIACPQETSRGLISPLSAGPPNWVYRLLWRQGCVSQASFTGFCPGTVGSLQGTAANTWYVLENGDGNDGDSIIFRATNPLSFGFVDGLVLSHPTCAGSVLWASGDTSGTIDGPLPVELISFEAVYERGTASLRWTTASELNNDRFEIERDGMLMASLPSLGNGVAEHQYEWRDAELLAGTSYRFTLYAVDLFGAREVLGERTVDIRSTAPAPREFALDQNFPNPFNPSTTISYYLAETAYTRLTVSNTMGAIVTLLVDGEQPVGEQRVVFDANALPSGVYFAQLTAGNYSRTIKMLMMR